MTATPEIAATAASVVQAAATIAAQQIITVTAPQNGASLSNPFELAGSVAQTPADQRLVYIVSDVNGGIVTSGTLTVSGEVHAPGTFSASVTYPQVPAGAAIVRVISVDSSTSAAVQFPVVTAQPQQGISLNLNGVASKAQGQTVQAYVKQRSYIDLDALPEHLRVLFDDDPTPKSFDPRARQLLIIPLNGYRKLFANAYAEQFDGIVRGLEAAIRQPDVSATRDYAVLPASDLQHPFKAQARVVQFDGGAGVRFITQFTQEITPVTSSSLTYVFQGLTSDGAYYIAAMFPIANNALAADATQVTKDERDLFKKDYGAYIANVVRTLDQNAPGFAPSLAALDALMASLHIGANPLAKPTPQPGATTAPSAAPSTANVTGRAIEVLNIRSAPNTRGRVLGQLQPNESATLLGRDANTQWIRVRTASGLAGWVSRKYLDTSADLSKLPVSK